MEEIFEKFDYLKKYLDIKIDNLLFSDSWFISFEKAFEQRNDSAYSIFIPHYSKAMQLYDGQLYKCPVSGLGNVEFKNVVCYKLGNYYKGKFIALSPWINNPNFDPNECELTNTGTKH